MSPHGKSGATTAVLAAVFSLGLLCSGCGDTFRPVATPMPQPGGDPQRSAHALVVSANGCIPPALPGTTAPGTAVDIDTTGDSNVGIFNVGRCPFHAAPVGGTDYVANRDDDSVAGFALSGLGNPPNLISLPTGAKPVFVATAQGKLFVAEYGLGKVAVIDPGTNSVATEVCSTDTDPCKVGSGPAALVATPDGTKLYCLNKDDGSVSVILPATNQLLRTITTGISTPIWGDVSADGTRVFVLNHAAPDNIAVIDTTSDATTDTVINSIPVGTESKYVIHQASQNRTYVASPGADSQCGNLLSPCLYVIENNTGIVTPVPMSGPPCNALDPIAVTALADGSRAYVADDKTNTVCVLNATNNAFTKRICLLNDSADPCEPPMSSGVPSPAPVFIASDPDSRRVLTANSGSGDVSIIDTISDTTVKKSDGTTPLTIPTGGTPTFIAITP